MATFIRFMRGETLDEACANAQADLERGYSFAAYQRYETMEDATASDEVRYLGVDADSITPLPEGGFGFALDGLCGFEHGDDDDALDLERAAAHNYGRGYRFVALYRGRALRAADQGDGDLFRPLALLDVQELPS